MPVEARDVYAGYGSGDVLPGVSLRLQPGELVGLIGPNGSGKSTLLRVLSRVLRPRSGKVLYDGRPAAAYSAREIAQRIAFVPQTEPALFDFTGWEVVLMGRHAHVKPLGGEREADFDAARRAMAETNTLPLTGRLITSMSGGEHRRILIARALA